MRTGTRDQGASLWQVVAGGDAAKRRNKTTGARATANSKTGDAPPHAAARSLAQPLRRSGPLHSDSAPRPPRAAPALSTRAPPRSAQPAPRGTLDLPECHPLAASRVHSRSRRATSHSRASVTCCRCVALARTVTRTPSLVARLHTSCRTCAWALWGAWGSVNKVRHSVPRSVVELSRCRVRIN